MPNRLTKGKALLGGANVPASGLSIAGTAVTATAAEINKLASVTAGTATASKAVVLDATRSIAGITHPVTTVTGDTTLTAADANKIIEINATATKTMTLPAANAVAAGVRFMFVLQVATVSGAGHTVHPVGTDVMRGNGFTAAAAKGAVNTQATARVGDTISIISNGVDAWYITGATGTWARES